MGAPVSTQLCSSKGLVLPYNLILSVALFFLHYSLNIKNSDSFSKLDVCKKTHYLKLPPVHKSQKTRVQDLPWLLCIRRYITVAMACKRIVSCNLIRKKRPALHFHGESLHENTALDSHSKVIKEQVIYLSRLTPR